MMKRRKFISNTTWAATSLLLPAAQIDILKAQPTAMQDSTLAFTINDDGSYHLSYGNIMLQNAYPLYDGVPLKVKSLNISPNKIEYICVGYSVIIKFSLQKQLLTISSTITGISTAPHWFAPLGNARVIKVQKYFYQGLGFSGPNGFADLLSEPYITPQKTEKGTDDNWMLESYLTSALIDADGSTLAVAAVDHNDYLQKTVLYNKQQRFGLINRHLLEENILLDASFATEQIPVKNTCQLPDLHIYADTSAWGAVSMAANAIAKTMNVKPMKAPRYHWCSWYIKGKEFSKNDLKSIIANLKKISPKSNVQTIQIDDGYENYYGDWLKIRPLWEDSTLEPAFKLIQDQGYKAGIWIGTFMVDKKSDLATQHPDWILKRKDGTYYEEMGGGSVILDTSHPDAFAYLQSVYKTMKKWGASFYKTDFMDWGLQDSVVADRYAKGKTSVQYYRQVLDMIRNEIGEDSYWLGCIAPFASSLGYVNGIRIAADTTENWANFDNIINQIITCQYFNNLYWQNDPDVMWLSTKSNRLSESEIKTIAYLFGIHGGSVNTSEWLNTPEQQKLWRFLEPEATPAKALFPYWGKEKKLEVVVRKYPSLNAYGILIFNRNNNTQSDNFKLSELTGIEEAHIFQWSEHGAVKISVSNQLEAKLLSHECRLYYVNTTGTMPPEKLSIGGKL
ncbi:MAG: glycoside hydrolase family 36 protein [Cytophagales bacterium]|nr:glycoside hydrolase family 36 protein [Cytophagales bacterium]